MGAEPAKTGTEEECLPGRGWRKSARSLTSGHCVQAAALAGGCIGVRDSRSMDAVLRFRPGAWRAFLAGIQGSGCR
jgi:hypothetical protein